VRQLEFRGDSALAQGWSHYAREVQCFNGAGDARVKVTCRLIVTTCCGAFSVKKSSNSCLWGLVVLWCVPNQKSAKQHRRASTYVLLVQNSHPHVLLRCPQVLLHPCTWQPPRDVMGKCDAVQRHIFKIVNMKMALKLKITMFRIYLGLNINPIKPLTALPNPVRLSL
jgi:hypothetical protein